MCHRRHDASKPKVAAIVQARLGSSRLPLKSLVNLAGLPIIDWVIRRLARSAEVDHIIVAVPDTPLDSILKTHLEEKGIECVTGPEDDVLTRFRLAAEKTAPDLVVRVCADNPLIWWKAVDQLVRFYKASSLDYAYNHIPRGNTWPDGLGAEIISADLLAKIDRKAHTRAQREHCLNYIWDNPADFRIGTFDPKEEWLRRPDLKFDIDTIEDFQRLGQMPINVKTGARELLEFATATPV